MLDRKTPPPYSLNKTLNLLQPEQVVLATGANIFFIQGGDQDVVKLELIFSAGRWFESIPGVSYLASHLLSKGTTAKTSNEIAQTLESLGIHLEIIPGFDFVSVNLFGLTKRIIEALAILYEICSSPAYSDNELTRAKNILLQNLKINREKTSYLATTAFREHLFGKNHPYGNEITHGDIQKIQPETLHTFHKSYFKHFTCFVTGKISNALKESITNTLSNIPFHSIEIRAVQSSKLDHNLFKVEKPGSIQISLRMGKRVISRSHPDYPNLIFANHALGGYFGSRLMQSLREDKGLTYGIYSTIHSLRYETYIVISTDINKEHIDFAIEEVKAELRKLRTLPMKSEELQLVKNHFLGSLFTEVSTPFAHTEKLKNIYLNNLDIGYYQNLIEQIQGMTAAKVIETADTHLHEENLLTVSAG
ncbi:MAG: M16 family metallopeptidase [Cyclobacteriaceae bacterium]